MKAVHKILTFIGAVFTAIGSLLSIVFLLNINVFGILILVPLFFVVLGVTFLVPGILHMRRNAVIKKNGVLYHAKIYGYTEDMSALVNGAYPLNTIVRFFDRNGKKQETILDTGFARGSNTFPIGMTINIYDLNGKIGWDEDSVRNEIIPDEAELLESAPINTIGKETMAVDCDSCGASFSAVKGYAVKCPYCGKFMNV